MEIEETKEKAKDVMDKVVKSSKDAFSKAGNVIQKLGDKSVQKIELMQLESKRKDEIKKLGLIAEQKFYKENAESLSKNDEEVLKILNELKKIDEDIEKHKVNN